MIRALAVIGIFLVAAGMGLPAGVSAQTASQGQAVGILFLLGGSRPGGQASAKTPGPGIAAASPKAVNRITDVKHKPPSVKEEPVLARTGGGATVSMLDRVARPSGRLDSAVLRVTSD